MKELTEIRDFIESRPQHRLVLCTLVRKSGSSFRAEGAKKIVSLEGETHGLLSGGCLEASIEKCAREGFARLPFIESFSTLAEEDRLLGYQTGCQGVIDILFENVHASELDLLLPFGFPQKFAGVRIDPVSFARSAVAQKPADEFFEPWTEPVRLFIIGRGADAEVYRPLTEALGWPTQFIDYRQSLLPDGEHAIAVEKMAAHIPQGPRTAVILMTHNYEADLEIVRGLRDHDVAYFGALGPAARWARLQDDLAKMYGEKIGARLLAVTAAPAGIFPHGENPEEIALSVLAQIQERLIEKPRAREWTLVLAAGASERFGGVKAMAEWRGESFLARSVRVAQSVSGDQVLVVTGAHDLAEMINEMSVAQVHNADWAKGMGTSIARGVRAILARDPKAEAIAILPVDQIFADADHLRALFDQSAKSGHATLTSDAENFGPPAVLTPREFAAAQELNGDKGLKAILKIGDFLCVRNDRALTDIDSRAELAQQT